MLRRILLVVLIIALIIPMAYTHGTSHPPSYIDRFGNEHYFIVVDRNNGDSSSGVVVMAPRQNTTTFVHPQSLHLMPGWTFVGFMTIPEDGAFTAIMDGNTLRLTGVRQNLIVNYVYKNNTTEEYFPTGGVTHSIDPCQDCGKIPCDCPCPICSARPCVCTPVIPTAPTLVPSINNPTAAYINLETETITLPFTAGAYSVNDGRSWKVGSLPAGEAFSKMLGKGMTLWVAQGYDKKTKRPTGTVVNFPTIERRPRGNTEKLKPSNQASTWELRAKDGSAPASAYLWAPTADRKTASGAWQNWSGSQPLPASKQKVTILLRSPALAVAETTTAPARYVPAGRAFRVTVKG